MHNPLYFIVSQLLKRNKINFNKESLDIQLQSHPTFPSLEAITGVLEYFDIEHIALKIEVNPTNLSRLPKNFIALIKTSNTEELAIIKNQNNTYKIVTDFKVKSLMLEDEFIKSFTGIFIAVEKSNNINYNFQGYSLINSHLLNFLLLVFTSGLLILTKINIPLLILLSSNILGLIISFSIKQQELGVNTIIGEKLCGVNYINSTCNSVLTSKGSHILGNLHLSDLSILYFLTQSLIVFIFQVFNINFSISFILPIIAFPIIFYSIYYQAIIIKKWCKLCLLIILILIIQFLNSLYNYNTSWEFVIALKETLLFSFFSVLVIYIYSKNIKQWHYSISSKQLKIKYQKLKKNFTIFITLIKKAKKVNTTITNYPHINFGNPNSPLKILVITNPFCEYCKSTHSHLNKILSKNKDKVHIQIIFSVNTRKKDSLLNISSRLLDIFFSKEEDLCFKALNDIYENQDTTSWQKKYGTCNDKSIVYKELDRQADWCSKNNLKFTPTILINGKPFPKEYERSDLYFFIESLYLYYNEN